MVDGLGLVILLVLLKQNLCQKKEIRDKAAAITDDIDGAATAAVIRSQGEMLDVDPDPDFASGGIARMLGE